jgi:acetylglutamate kinase
MTAAADHDSEADAIQRAQVISAALPYMLRYDGKVVVVKYGGHAMGDPELARAFARDITLLETSGVHPVVVHGGGPQIGQMLDRLGIKSEFKGGLRVTDKATVEVVEMVLAGSINKEIVMAINAEGGKAVGLSGKDGNMVFAERAGDGAGKRVGVDVVGVAVAARRHRRDDRDQFRPQHHVDDGAVDHLRLADEAEVDRLLDVAVRVLGRARHLARCDETTILAGDADGLAARLGDPSDQFLVDRAR